MTTEQLYTSKQVAAELGVTHGRVRQLAAALGVGTKLGDAWVFRSSDLEALRNRSTAAGRPPSSTNGKAAAE